MQALEELNKVRGAAVTDEEREELEAKYRSIQSQLGFQQNYEEGIRYYNNKEWQKAKDAFARALKIRPNDASARKYYEDADARAQATVKEMPPNLRVKFLRAVELYRQGQYQEAVRIGEELNKEQPYNKRILDFIDRAREKLQEKNRK